ncbi:hypothetical protein [Actinomadura nitritigenes]|uniref:hypothetical protein n=1 Tax=Actinomadura nitritigenes TaxID=134602 RepID=UPI003D8ACA66
MGVSQSNLSRYGVDLVIAVTQASVNATLKQLLAEVDSPEVTLCYVYDSHNNILPIDYQTLISEAKGSDPFTVPDGADPTTDQDLINLKSIYFAGGVKAAIGLPGGVLPADLPAIATLGAGTSAPVLFNLLCSEFQIVGFEYGGPNPTWTNMAQPTTGKEFWYFSANINLNTTSVDPNSNVPPAVQQRIIELQHQVQNAFTIQKLFLDLDTAILERAPDIKGIPDSLNAVWQLVSKVFLGAYFGQLRQTGDPVLNYAFTVDSPLPATLQLGAVSRECCPLLDNGQPISDPTPAQQDAATLVYLGSGSTTPPVPVPFPWNWVELADVPNFSGIQAVRRDIFLSFLSQLFNTQIIYLCMSTNIYFNYEAPDFFVNYTSQVSDSPSAFQVIDPPGEPGSDGFTDVLSFKTYYWPTHQKYKATADIIEMEGDYNCNLDASVAINGNQIRIVAHPVVYMMFEHWETAFANYVDLPGANYYDKTMTAVFTLGVDQNGEIQVSHDSNVVDDSAPSNLHPKGILGGTGELDEIAAEISGIGTEIGQNLDLGFADLVTAMAVTLNGYGGWVFSGNDAFTFKDVTFSEAFDLTVQLNYVDPA